MRGRGMQRRGVAKRRVVPFNAQQQKPIATIVQVVGRGQVTIRGQGLGRGVTANKPQVGRGAIRGAAPNIIQTRGMRGPKQGAMQGRGGVVQMRGMRGGLPSNKTAPPINSKLQAALVKNQRGLVTQNAGRGQIKQNNAVIKVYTVLLTQKRGN